jgi:hypothetical protein
MLNFFPSHYFSANDSAADTICEFLKNTIILNNLSICLFCLVYPCACLTAVDVCIRTDLVIVHWLLSSTLK